MTMTKTKQKTYLDTIRDAEEDMCQRAEDLRAKLIEARGSTEKFQSLHEEAEDAFVDLRSRLNAGDDSVTVSEYAHAKVAVEVAEILNESPAKVIARLERSQISTNVELAEAAAHVVEPLFTGFTVITTFVDAPTPDDISDLPVLVIRQGDLPQRHTPSGRLSGQVELTLYRSQAHTPLVNVDLDKAFSDAANVHEATTRMSVRSGEIEGTGMFVDKGYVTLNMAHSPLPVIPGEPNEQTAWNVAGLIGSVIYTQVQASEGYARKKAMDPNWYSGDAGSVKATSAHIESANVDDDGIRRTVVVCEHEIVRGGDNNVGRVAMPVIAKGAEAKFEKGAGVVAEVAAEVTNLDQPVVAAHLRSKVMVLSRAA